MQVLSRRLHRETKQAHELLHLKDETALFLEVSCNKVLLHLVKGVTDDGDQQVEHHHNVGKYLNKKHKSGLPVIHLTFDAFAIGHEGQLDQLKVLLEEVRVFIKSLQLDENNGEAQIDGEANQQEEKHVLYDLGDHVNEVPGS